MQREKAIVHLNVYTENIINTCAPNYMAVLKYAMRVGGTKT